MNDYKLVGMIQRDLEDRLNSVNIIIRSYPDVEHCLTMYRLIDDITGRVRMLDILEKELVDLDMIHKALYSHDKIIAEAQLLINERYS